jgi:hypothetical protein
VDSHPKKQNMFTEIWASRQRNLSEATVDAISSLIPALPAV